MIDDEPAQPVRWTDINGVEHSSAPGTMRSFSLNSREFYDAVTEPRDPWTWGPGLPSQPRVWGQRVVVESTNRRG